MGRTLAERLRRLLPAVWLGLLLSVAFIAAPAPFAVLASADAGRVNARVFLHEAWASVALALLLWLLERWRAQRLAAAGQGSMFSTEMVLLVGVLLCTIGGHFALQPLLAAARAGQAGPSFGQLHALSVGLYCLKLLLVAGLAWRGAAPR